MLLCVILFTPFSDFRMGDATIIRKMEPPHNYKSGQLPAVFLYLSVQALFRCFCMCLYRLFSHLWYVPLTCSTFPGLFSIVFVSFGWLVFLTALVSMSVQPFFLPRVSIVFRSVHSRCLPCNHLHSRKNIWRKDTKARWLVAKG